MFSFTQFSPNGTSLDRIATYFDDSILLANDMRSGATQQSYMYFYYTGDGDYYVEFDDFSSIIEVKIPIIKE